MSNLNRPQSNPAVQGSPARTDLMHIAFIRSLMEYKDQLEGIGAVIVHDSIQITNCKYEDLMRVLPHGCYARSVLKQNMFARIYGRGHSIIVDVEGME